MNPHTAALAQAARDEQAQRVLAIDPGTTESAFVLLEDGKPTEFGKLPNAEMLALLRRRLISLGYPVVVIEQVASYGMAVGQEVFETVFWSGRFAEAAHSSRVERITRKAVVTHLCNSSKANDSNVRAALIDRFGGIGGKEAAIGRKASPGPLYGLHADCRAALAVALTWADHDADPKCCAKPEGGR